MVVRTCPTREGEEGRGDRRNPADNCSGDRGGAARRPLVWSSDPVKFQKGGGACLIEKSLLHFLLRLLRCTYSANPSCHVTWVFQFCIPACWHPVTARQEWSCSALLVALALWLDGSAVRAPPAPLGAQPSWAQEGVLRASPDPR